MAAPTPSHAQLGYSVRRLRQARHLTIDTLAETAQMHPTYLSGIERGERNPTWTKLCNLADALDVSVSTIVAVAESRSRRVAQPDLDELELELIRPRQSPDEDTDFDRAH
ncbi:MAG TPA: helix-turn-helix transcriptional regulator [Solirubrobacteraceae bacterium]|nr:helix-turn-helix transcriptional regulator [Solirubrobacteraceae bacterium]